MPVTAITPDPDALTLTVVFDADAPIDRLWAAWTDPRLLERFWGPPEWPATFTALDLRPGGRAAYHMTGPNGESSRGFWIFEEVAPPRTFAVADGFAHEDGSEDATLPGTGMRVTLTETPTGSRATVVSRFASRDGMEQLLAMGALEGFRAALGQLDATLADPEGAALRGSTRLEVVDNTHVTVTRTLHAPLAEVWRALVEADRIARWMLGPDGWSMAVCEPATTIGGAYRYEWVEDATGARFGFTGELLEREPPRREVATERLVGMEGPGTVNEVRLRPLPGGRTEIRTDITYPSADVRDAVLATGMVDGMEASYDRLERLIAGRA
jgi:uncharacterized protein YndB with AHSA1/START domain